MRTKFIGDKHEYFESAFNFAHETTTIYYSPGEGFYVLIGGYNKTERAYFKATVNNLSVTFHFDNGDSKAYWLGNYPIYFHEK